MTKRKPVPMDLFELHQQSPQLLADRLLLSFTDECRKRRREIRRLEMVLVQCRDNRELIYRIRRLMYAQKRHQDNR